MTFRTRFAPSPTGPLHLGHAYSALLAYDMAVAEGGEFLLRIEDIDRARARPEWEERIYDDLRWLGIWWPEPVMRQSDRAAAYQSALDDLWQRELVYICTCSRRDIELAASAPQEGAEPAFGPDGLIYPGTCRGAGHGPIDPVVERPRDAVLRLDMARAAALVTEHRIDGKGPWSWVTEFTEDGIGPNGERGRIEIRDDTLLNSIGDVVLARRDMGTSYHLSVVLDDAAQGISHVVRGQDLFEATKIHVVLQKLLGLPTPTYHHHKLIRDENGKRLAKRDDARAIAKFRQEGATPKDIRRMVGL